MLVRALEVASEKTRNEAAEKLVKTLRLNRDYHAAAVAADIFKPLRDALLNGTSSMRWRIGAMAVLAELCVTQNVAIAATHKGFVVPLVDLAADTQPTKVRQAATAVLACIVENGGAAVFTAVKSSRVSRGAIPVFIRALVVDDGSHRDGAIRALASYVDCSDILAMVGATNGVIPVLVHALTRDACQNAAAAILYAIVSPETAVPARDAVRALAPAQVAVTLLLDAHGMATKITMVVAVGLLHILFDGGFAGEVDDASTRGLVKMLSSPHGAHAAFALVALTCRQDQPSENTKAVIVAAGAVPALVKMMGGDRDIDAERDSGAIVPIMLALTTTQAGRDALVRKDAVPELLRMLRKLRTSPVMSDMAGRVLLKLALDGVLPRGAQRVITGTTADVKDGPLVDRLAAVAQVDATVAKYIIVIMNASDTTASQAVDHTLSTGAEVGRQIVHALGICRAPIRHRGDAIVLCAYPQCWGSVHVETPLSACKCCIDKHGIDVRYCSTKCQTADWGCHKGAHRRRPSRRTTSPQGS